MKKKKKKKPWLSARLLARNSRLGQEQDHHGTQGHRNSATYCSVLFNGGVFRAASLKNRLSQVLAELRGAALDGARQP